MPGAGGANGRARRRRKRTSRRSPLGLRERMPRQQNVIRRAKVIGREDIEQWALANHLPEPNGDDDSWMSEDIYDTECPYLSRRLRFRLNDNYLGLRVASLLLSLARSTTFVAADDTHASTPGDPRSFPQPLPSPRRFPRPSRAAFRGRRSNAKEPSRRHLPAILRRVRVRVRVDPHASRGVRIRLDFRIRLVFAFAFPAGPRTRRTCFAMSPWCMATCLRIASASRAAFISLAWSRHAKSARFSAALVNIATARLDFARSCTIHATCSSHAMKNLRAAIRPCTPSRRL